MIKNCKRCNFNKVQKYGKNRAGQQRYFCKKCGCVFIWKNTKNKINKEQVWFKWWIKEGLSIRQISRISGHSPFKLKQIKNYWLCKEAESIYQEYKKAKYLIFDGTYFKRTNCLMLFMNDEDSRVVGASYLDKESYENVYAVAKRLKQKGVEPKSITLDGHKSVISAIKEVWPEIIIQRCLYHIEHQGQMWLRSNPKTSAGKDLKYLYSGVANIKTVKEKDEFTEKYRVFLRKHREFINNANYKEAGYKDLKKAMSLINNAYDDMWHFLADKNIPSTTNKLEGYFSELKLQYKKHKGMSRLNRDSYLKWYIYYKNN